MSVSLDKVVKPLPYGMDNEAWNSRIMLPMYMATVFPTNKAYAIYQALESNMYEGLQVLLHFEHSYDNAKGECV